jgi:hypothetical protein
MISSLKVIGEIRIPFKICFYFYFSGMHGQGNTDGDEPPPKKTPKPPKPEGEICCPCSVWVQTGRKLQQSEHHQMTKQRVAGANATIFSNYLSHETINIILEEDSVICNGCYLDAYKHAHNTCTDKVPRWLSLQRAASKSNKSLHCLLCHHDRLRS